MRYIQLMQTTQFVVFQLANFFLFFSGKYLIAQVFYLEGIHLWTGMCEAVYLGDSRRGGRVGPKLTRLTVNLSVHRPEAERIGLHPKWELHHKRSFPTCVVCPTLQWCDSNPLTPTSTSPPRKEPPLPSRHEPLFLSPDCTLPSRSRWSRQPSFGKIVRPA